MNNWCICWFSRIFLLAILIFKGLTARRLYKSFSVKGLRINSGIPNIFGDYRKFLRGRKLYFTQVNIHIAVV
jgi:hypothetical protein